MAEAAPLAFNVSVPSDGLHTHTHTHTHVMSNHNRLGVSAVHKEVRLRQRLLVDSL